MDTLVLKRLQEVPQDRFAREVLTITNKDGDVVPLDCTGRPGQQRLQEVISYQESNGRPVRIILVKSRQFGGSTWIQGYLLRKAITQHNRRILVVAQKMATSESLFNMADGMYSRLPNVLRPPLGGFANPMKGTKILHFGEKIEGRITGLNSKIEIDTAQEVAGGRGFTFTDMHLTECAHWPDVRKALSLMPAVGKRPGTSIFLESTANGLNWFHQRFKWAKEGISEFEPVFVGWWEDPDCVRHFASEEQREAFIATIGDTERSIFAEEEPWLIEQFGCTPEQLYFRRTAIVDECDGKVEFFKQEYPATWDEAFIGSGRQVFSVVYTQRAVRAADRAADLKPEDGGPRKGLFRGLDVIERSLSDGLVKVPQRVEWVPQAEIPARMEWWPGQFWEPGDPLWTLWLPEPIFPGREWTAEMWRQAHERGDVSLEDMEDGIARALLGPGQFIVVADPADDIENNSPSEKDEHAYNGVVGIDHRTGRQVAEYQARQDHDLVARHIYLCGMFLNEAWVSVERTGGYGLPMLNLLHKRFYYRHLYTEKRLDTKTQKKTTRHGWLTDRGSKPQMEATAQALLREETHGVTSPRLASEFVTYIKNDRGKHEPGPGSFSDLLLAWMQAHEIRRLTPLRPAPTKTDHRANSATRPMWRY